MDVISGRYSIVPEWLIDSPVSDRAVRLYAIIRRYGRSSGKAFPGRKTLSERLDCSLDSIDRAMKELIDVGAMEKELRTTASGRKTTSAYRLFDHPFGRERAAGVGREGAANPSGREGAANHGRSGAATTPLTDREIYTESNDRELRLVETSRARNPLWDALSEMFGEPQTTNEKSLQGKIVSELKRAGATPEEVIRRCQAWPLHFDGATLTATALLKHWTALGRDPLRASNHQVKNLQGELDRFRRDEELRRMMAP